MAFDESHPRSDVILFGKDGEEIADSAGRIPVTTTIVAPPGSSVVGDLAIGNVTGNSEEDSDYVVPDTKVLDIYLFVVGGQMGYAGKFQLFHSTDGGTTDGTLLAFGYTGADGNFPQALNYKITGDGTDQVVRMRRERTGGGTAELAARWEGVQTD